ITAKPRFRISIPVYRQRGRTLGAERFEKELRAHMAAPMPTRLPCPSRLTRSCSHAGWAVACLAAVQSKHEFERQLNLPGTAIAEWISVGHVGRARDGSESG